MNSFLTDLASILCNDKVPMENSIVVLPSKRGAEKLLADLQGNQNGWLPTVFTLSGLLQNILPHKPVKQLQKLNALSSALHTLKINNINIEHDYHLFQRLISDIEEIKQTSNDPAKLYKEFSAVKTLERWDVSETSLGNHSTRVLGFWKLLPKIAAEYFSNLEKTGCRGQTDVLKSVDSKIVESYKNLSGFDKVWVVGFSVFSASEKKFINVLSENFVTEIVFDFDNFYLNKHENAVGQFLLNKKNENLPNTRNLNSNWESSGQQVQQFNFSLKSNLLNGLFQRLYSLSKLEESVGVVFADQSLMQIAIHKLSSHLPDVNVGIGMPLGSTAIGKLVKHLILVEHIDEVLLQETGVILTTENRKELEALFDSKGIRSLEQLVESCLKFLEIISTTSRSDALPFLNASIHEIQVVLVRFTEDYKKNGHANIPQSIVKQSLVNDLVTSSVSTVGSKNSRIQFLGLLESRTLDFKHVLLVAPQDELIPGVNKSQSFIPQDLRHRYHLVTNNDSENLIGYYFYQSMQRATSLEFFVLAGGGGVVKTEESRFLKFLKFNHPPFQECDLAQINQKSWNQSSEKIEIPTNEDIANSIREKLEGVGCSASMLNLLVRNKLDFYLKYVLGVKEPPMTLHELNPSVLGDVVHKALERVYTESLNVQLSVELLNTLEKKASKIIAETLKDYSSKFNSVYIRSTVTKVTQKWITKMIAYDKKRVLSGDIIIIRKLEEERSMLLKIGSSANSVKLYGIIDRVEQLNGQINLLDYKTGLVTGADLKVDSVEEIFENPKKSKVLQMLFYSLLYSGNSNQKIRSGVVSFRNIQKGLLYPVINGNEEISHELLHTFREEIVMVLTNQLEEQHYYDSEEHPSKYLHFQV